LIRALLRAEGLRVGSGSGAGFVDRLKMDELPEVLRQRIVPLIEVMGHLNEQIKELDRELAALSGSDEVIRRLRTAPASDRSRRRASLRRSMGWIGFEGHIRWRLTWVSCRER
jgi:transposase